MFPANLSSKPLQVGTAQTERGEAPPQPLDEKIPGTGQAVALTAECQNVLPSTERAEVLKSSRLGDGSQPSAS